MIRPGLDERVYPSIKLAAILESLAAEGVSADDALSGTGLSSKDVFSPGARVSLNQIIGCLRNADRLTSDPHLGFRAGLRLHVSAYGMYGFAMLCCTSFRQTARFASQYHLLATPLADISFSEDDNYAIWIIRPLPHPRMDAQLYKFFVEMQFGIHTVLYRDIMGVSFSPQELQVTYGPPKDAADYPDLFGCPVRFGQPENKFIFSSAWLNEKPKYGNEIIYPMVAKLCDAMVDELQLRIGVTGKVREFLLGHLMRSTFDEVAVHLHMSERTLRRKLREEKTSFRKIADELRMNMAIRYLRDTSLTIEDIAYSLGFSDAANFRHAFQRWTKATPGRYRDQPALG